MKALQVSSRWIIGLGLLFYATFGLTKNSFKWPALIVDNIFWICMSFIAAGYVLLIIYHMRTKNPKKAIELVIMAVVIVVFFLLVKLISK